MDKISKLLSSGWHDTTYSERNKNVLEGVHEANKSSYDATFIGAKIILGQEIPTHFKMKYNAKDDNAKFENLFFKDIQQ